MNAARKPPEDWHPADVAAALRKKGYRLADVGRELGLAPASIHKVYTRPWSTVEGRIAEIIGVPPWEIWPARYSSSQRMTRLRRAAIQRFPFRPRNRGQR